jgi:hypothetical protein
MSKRLLLILSLLVIAGGCLTAAYFIRVTSPRWRAEKVLFQIGPEPLREAAARLYKDQFAAHVADYLTLKDNQCPSQFSAFKPNYVGAYRDGFALALTSDQKSEAGIYVIPAHTDLQPRVTSRWRYERLADGVYWYSFDR